MFEHLYGNKFEDLDSMHKFLGVHTLANLIQEEINYLNSCICILKNECTVKILLPVKFTGTDGFTGKFYPMLKKEQQFCIHFPENV